MRVQLQAKCPTCGGVHDVLPRGAGFVMTKHEASNGFSRFDCAGGSPPAAEVLQWARAARAEAERLSHRDDERERARAALAQELKRIDAREVEKRADVEAYDRAIKRIEKKVTT